MRWRRLPRPVRVIVLAVAAAMALSLAPFAWTRVASAGHLYRETSVAAASTPSPGGPRADVALVLGAQVAPGGQAPMPVLRGRLDTAAALLRAGVVKVILVSGDAHGGSGNETAAMTSYLTRTLGVDPARVVADPDGLDTYDSCLRAKTVFGVKRALLVTQAYHLPRAVALCRHVGVDVDGVAARCDGCRRSTLIRNAMRDYLACVKAASDALRGRAPAVTSPPSDAVHLALFAVRTPPSPPVMAQ